MSLKQNSGHSVEILLILILLTVAGECDCSVLDGEWYSYPIGLGMLSVS